MHYVMIHVISKHNTAYLPKFTIFIIILISLFIFSVLIGRYTINFTDFINLLALKATQQSINAYTEINTIIFSVRLPRIVASILIGSSLAVSGTVFQSVFRNPMVSADVLGAANGAGFGAALGILLSLGYYI
ncbi:MAG TPA: hypothetical protein DCK76_10725 [Desulfotomaculum sp.]|nr:hypothetical protein [Desulfotomaculum sp.]